MKKYFSNTLLTGSFLLFIGNMAANVANYIYHLIMGRMLGPVEYGALSSVISLAYLTGVPTSVLNIVVVKRVSELQGLKKIDEVWMFRKWLNDKVSKLSLFLAIPLIALSFILSKFLHLDSIFPIVWIFSLSMMAMYLMINTSIFQGSLRFGLVSGASALQATVKLGLAIVFVAVGMGVSGASLSLLMCTLATYFFTQLFIGKPIKRDGGHGANMTDLLSYTVPVALSLFSLVSLYTTDVMLARHFLSQKESGYYASLALLGKIIFFASNSVSMATFPIISRKNAAGEDFIGLVKVSFLLVAVICLTVSLFYFIVPEKMVVMLFGIAFAEASRYLPLFSIFMSFYCLSYLGINFFLSIRRNLPVYFSLIAAALQFVLLIFFHKNIYSFIYVSAIVCSLLLVSLLVYFGINYESIKGKGERSSYRHRSGI